MSLYSTSLEEQICTGGEKKTSRDEANLQRKRENENHAREIKGDCENDS